MIKQYKIEVTVNDGDPTKIEDAVGELVRTLIKYGIRTECCSITEYAGVDSEVVTILPVKGIPS